MTTALLLMDLQNSIVERYGAADSYLDRVVAAQERAEQAGLLVVLVRVRFAPGRPEVSPRNEMFARVGTVGADDRGLRAARPAAARQASARPPTATTR